MPISSKDCRSTLRPTFRPTARQKAMLLSSGISSAPGRATPAPTRTATISTANTSRPWSTSSHASDQTETCLGHRSGYRGGQGSARRDGLGRRARRGRSQIALVQEHHRIPSQAGAGATVAPVYSAAAHHQGAAQLHPPRLSSVHRHHSRAQPHTAAHEASTLQPQACIRISARFRYRRVSRATVSRAPPLCLPSRRANSRPQQHRCWPK